MASSINPTMVLFQKIMCNQNECNADLFLRLILRAAIAEENFSGTPANSKKPTNPLRLFVEYTDEQHNEDVQKNKISEHVDLGKIKSVSLNGFLRLV